MLDPLRAYELAESTTRRPARWEAVRACTGAPEDEVEVLVTLYPAKYVVRGGERLPEVLACEGGAAIVHLHAGDPEPASRTTLPSDRADPRSGPGALRLTTNQGNFHVTQT